MLAKPVYPLRVYHFSKYADVKYKIYTICYILLLSSALNVIFKSLDDVDSISELQIVYLKEEIKIIPGFEAASLNVKIRR
jgi:hypothetical protein